MAWASVVVAGIGAAAAVAKADAAKGAGSAGVPGFGSPMMSGDIESVTDHSNWVVNFGHGSGNGTSTGGMSGEGVPLLWIAVGVAVFLLRRKKT